MRQKKIIVYSTKSCPYCDMVKAYFRSKKISFEEIDVGADRDRAVEMVAKSGQMGVPVVEIDGKIIVGFDKKAIDEELAK